MTILVAVKDSNTNETHLLGDSMTNNWVGKFHFWDKWTAFKNFYIWFAGDVNAHLYIREYIYDELNELTAETARDVVDIYKMVESWLETEFQAKRTETADRDHLDMGMIVVSNSGKIFTCSQYLNISEHEDYWVIGSGVQYAIGGLSILKKLKKVNAKNLLLLMNTVIENDLHCWAPIHLITLRHNEQANI